MLKFKILTILENLHDSLPLDKKMHLWFPIYKISKWSEI